ncbi:FUSC family protein [Actinocorallia longicatena]|uniref:Integral membrane bound transporter domain-containing protein n=1 Tax=Actinocorallia longicatena TaxID=111803 RepID=A0ABP6QDI5_9ACTN
MFERVRARAAIDYGLTAAVGVALPLLLGALTGHVDLGSWGSLGAFFLANSAPDGPYGLPTRRLWATLGVVAVCVACGAALAGNLWLAAIFVPLAAALSVAVSWIGFTAPLVLVTTTVQPPGADFGLQALCEIAGGLWMICLMLLPFERRIQRPVRTSVAAVARDLADLLVPAGTLEDADWENARAEAAETFAAAREAQALKRSVEGADRGERLIDALARVLHEVVTLRALSSDKVLWTVFPAGHLAEIDEAVAYQAARLRSLAEAIGNGHPLPEGDTGPLERLAARIERPQQEWADEDTEHVGIFVLHQIRRSLARIGSTVDSAARLAAELSFERAPLRLPHRPHPVEKAGAALTHMAERSPKFRYATRLAASTGTGMVALAVFRPEHGHWLPLSAMLTTRDTYGETVHRVTGRIGGTLVGGTIAALLLQAVHSKVLLALVVFCFALPAYAFRHVGYGVWVVLMTPTVMTVIDFSAPIGWDVAVSRILLNVAGALIGLAAGRLLWPRAGAALVPERMERLRHTHADLVRSIAARLDGKPDAFAAAHTAARLAATDLAAARTRLAAEPVPDTEEIAALRSTLASAQRIRDHLQTLHRLMPEGTFDPGPIPEILDKVADGLDERTAPEVAPLLKALDAHLADLARARREELLAGTALDERTPLRRALLHVAAVRHALRGLSRDTLG